VFATPRAWPTLVLLIASAWLLLIGLDNAGMLGPDEPRYASIGREMARSGDWLTPRLWGQAWFEKPPLLYWMIAAATRAGLRDETAARLPVALLSAAFLVFYHRSLSKLFDARTAWYATAILGTSAGWLAYSHLALTDLPMAAAFAAAMLLAMPWALGQDDRALPASGVLLGLAVLAKGMVPLVLAVPALWMGRRRWRRLLVPVALLAFTAGPWFLYSVGVHGRPFLEEFFWKHHLLRFSGARMHPQPFWFYVPVLAAGLFPWTPLLALRFDRRNWLDPRVGYLWLWFLFGFSFFSLATNKLPGYLLPLLPALAAILSVNLVRSGKRGCWLLAVTTLSLGLLPWVARVLPQAVQSGLSRAQLLPVPWTGLAVSLPVALLVFWWHRRGRRAWAFAIPAALVVAGVLYFKTTALGKLDQAASARPLWRSLAGRTAQACQQGLQRNWLYGLNYYSVEPLPDCAATPRPLRIVQEPGAPPHLSE